MNQEQSQIFRAFHIARREGAVLIAESAVSEEKGWHNGESMLPCSQQEALIEEAYYYYYKKKLVETIGDKSDMPYWKKIE